MKIKLEFNDLAGSSPKKAFFSRVTCRLEKALAKYSFSSKNCEVSLAIVSEQDIRRLNRSYRGINKATDVLSFSEFSGQNQIRRQKDNKLFLGEVILCYDNIKRYAKSEKIDFEKELAKVFAHGILHLFGFRHGSVMISLQEKVKGNK